MRESKIEDRGSKIDNRRIGISILYLLSSILVFDTGCGRGRGGKADHKTNELGETIEKAHVRSSSDPRVHFALNCMSHSCPPLRNEPYEGSRLDAQLMDQGKTYLSDPRGAQKGEDGTVKLSEIFAKFYTAEWIAA